ncbi:MAG: divergent polysaccharide deacetylase family protein [Alphaproteobacteria bacterium]|nr:divergent polysaccharide deacetylase family protein [Alphaproteobacteria bacterium]
MKRPLAVALGVLLALLLVVAVTDQLAQRAVRGGSAPPAQRTATPAQLDALDAALVRALGDAAGEALLQQREAVPRVLQVRLSSAEPPEARAEALRSALSALDAAEVYATSENGLDVTVRVYVGPQLTHRVELLAGGEQLPALTGDARPGLALVVTGLGRDGPAAARVLRARVPLTVAIEPFTPFALRQSRDAVRAHKEVLLQLPEGEDAAAPEALTTLLTGVYHPSGLALHDGHRTLPLEPIRRHPLFLFHPHGLHPDLNRQARAAGVRTVAPDLDLSREAEGWEGRLVHLAATHGAAVAVVPLASADAAVRWLASGAARVRPLYLTEALDVRHPEG